MALSALVVDDNADIRMLIDRLLTAAGYVVEQAPGGPEALAMLARKKPDVVVLDVQMPRMDGWSTLEQIRANAATSDVPVVMCTVKGRAEDAVRAWQTGCDAFVSKPFGVGELVATVSEVVARPPQERVHRRQEALSAAQRLEAIELP